MEQNRSQHTGAVFINAMTLNLITDRTGDYHISHHLPALRAAQCVRGAAFHQFIETRLTGMRTFPPSQPARGPSVHLLRFIGK